MPGRAHSFMPRPATVALWMALALFIAAVTVTSPVAGSSAPGDARPTTTAPDNRRCLNCHGQPHIADLTPAERRTMVLGEATTPEALPGLYVVPEHFTQHQSLRCVDCHRDAAALPHAAVLEPATCDSGCHGDDADRVARGAHGQALERGDPDAPRCATCHGGHDIRPATDRRSQLHPLNITSLCGDCHGEHTDPVTGRRPGPEAIEQYLASVHGRAVAVTGLVVAATCVSCHGAHDVRPSDDPQSLVHRAQVATTCGQCHLGIEGTYMQSIHGQALADGRDDAPVCTDCHTAHAITRADTPAFMRDIVNECGDCHNQPGADGRRVSLYDSYRRSYHGQVTLLGSMRAARCSDCHGAHDILPASSPQSRIHPDNRLQMCASCHPRANANFVLYAPHADHRDRERYPLLYAIWLYFIILMSATFGFFGLHSLLWFVRSGIERVRRGRPRPPRANPHTIRRFNRVDRINHALAIVTFFGLTLTGMPLMFADQAWAAKLTAMMGGVHGAGLLHRIFAVGLMLNFVVHMVGVARRMHRHGVRRILFGPNSMLPRWKDVTDCIGMFRWFFGGPKPRFDRWTYWEKFDYWAEIAGTIIIGGTGLLLWFPEFFSTWLPGWVLNAAFIIHGYEALLAVGFIFTIHFFNAHLRWEKFPVDDVMFTGRLPEEEFAHERPLEYERLRAAGELKNLYTTPPPRWQRPLAVGVGILAMAIGITMVVLIVTAGLGIM